MRIELAKVLLRKPDVLLLDEPTNHLDIESIEWFEDYLKSFPGAIVLISHDRKFLDNITKRTVEIMLASMISTVRLVMLSRNLRSWEIRTIAPGKLFK